MNDDPKDTRMIQTRHGVAKIPRTQEGVPLRDYFQNTEMPEDLNRAQVFVTADGPVLARPDPVPWSNEHDEKVRRYAVDLKELIDTKGYYKPTLARMAASLANVTGYSEAETKARIVDEFISNNGKDPFKMVKERHEARNLPMNRGANATARNADHEPEM